MSTPILKYRPDIDGLRAIAVLLVVGFHAFPTKIPGGFIGVDIFFVISGFLISIIIFESLEKKNFSIIEFYVRRTCRIFPALFAVMLTTIISGTILFLPDELKQLGKHIAGGATFVSNFILWRESGYFDTAADTKTMLHLWSLAIEEQFYIFWPLLLALCWKNKWNFLKITLLIAFISFSIGIYLTTNNRTAAFYSPVARFWELMIGGTLAYASLHQTSFLKKYKDTQSITGIALLFIGIGLITRTSSFPGWWALLPTLGAFLIISAGPVAWVNKNILSTPPLVWIGLISYPLYLWHWPLLSFARIIESGLPSRELRAFAVLLSMALAFLTYKFLEKPIRTGGGLRTKSVALSILVASVGAFGLTIFLNNGLFTINKNFSQTDAFKQLGDAPLEYINNLTCMKKYPYERPGNANHWFCMLSRNENPTLLLLGNSFANHHYPGFANNVNLNHHSILSIGICDAADPATAGETDFIEDRNSACHRNNKLKEQQLIDSIVKKSKTIRYAIIDGLRRDPDESYIARLKKRIDFLESENVKVIVFLPHFIHFTNIKDCLPRPFRDATTCNFDIRERTELLEKFNPLIVSISKSNKNVLFYDQNNLFCDEKQCSLLRNGMPLSRDLTKDEHGGHFSIYASNESAKLFVDWAKKNSPGLLY